MHNELFKIGSLVVHGYGLMIGIGILMAYLTATFRARKYNINEDHLIDILIYGVIFGFLSAKLLYFVTIIDQIIADPSMLLQLNNGFVVYGGILGGILAAYVYLRIKKADFLTYTDLVLPSVALAQGFGRIGCFLAGCCYGVETHSHFSITFKESMYAPNGVSLFPSQLVSSGFDFLLFFILCAFYKKDKTKGKTTALYLIFYSVGRFIIEFFRGDLERGSVGALSTSQFISIFVMIFGVVMFFVSKKRQRKSYI